MPMVALNGCPYDLTLIPSFRFKFHLDDLSFLETISQTSTSAQVKIKSEVMSSNSQCASISDCISEVRRLVEAEVCGH